MRTSPPSEERVRLPASNPHGLSLLVVRDGRIVDADGRPVYLRGFQGLGFYPIPADFFLRAVWEHGIDPTRFDDHALDLSRYTLTQFDLDEIRSTGANVVRLWVHLHEIQRPHGQYSQRALELLERTVGRFGEAGIYVVLVLGTAAQNTYVESEFYTQRGLSLWDRGDGFWEQTLGAWRVLARRFAGNPYVAGYDVINEPDPPSRKALHAYYRDAIAAIRGQDGGHIIFLAVAEHNEHTYQVGGRHLDANVATTFHFYYPHDFTLEPRVPGLTYPGSYDFCLPGTDRRDCGRTWWTRRTLERIFEVALHLDELRGGPILVGEFGAHAVRDGSGGRQWIRDVMSIMDERGLHYTFHNYKHRDFQGYWIMKPEVKERVETALARVAAGNLEYGQVTDEQKSLLTTQRGFYRRPGIKEILTSHFGGSLGRSQKSDPYP